MLPALSDLDFITLLYLVNFLLSVLGTPEARDFKFGTCMTLPIVSLCIINCLQRAQFILHDPI